MKRLHRPDLWSWSVFDTARNLDFHSVCWVRPDGNVLIDPLVMSPHDVAHLADLGPVSHIVVTNSDHLRDAVSLAEEHGATLWGPRAEKDTLGADCDHWVGQGDEVVPGLSVHELHGSKTPGELALVLEETTLITGDLIRAHQGGSLNLLPQPKLVDRAAVILSVQRLAALPQIQAVLVGDGWPIFRGGGDALRELAASL